MKGIIVSLIVFSLYVLATAWLSHVLHPKRHFRLFAITLIAFTPVYFVVFVFSSDDLAFLSRAWVAQNRSLDMAYGYAVLLLNAHSYIDFFFGFNGGFSMSLLKGLHEAGEKGRRTEDIAAAYITPDGLDKIYQWRLPQVQKQGLVQIDEDGMCRLTRRGMILARFVWFCKRLLNLDKGG